MEPLSFENEELHKYRYIDDSSHVFIRRPSGAVFVPKLSDTPSSLWGSSWKDFWSSEDFRKYVRPMSIDPSTLDSVEECPSAWFSDCIDYSEFRGTSKRRVHYTDEEDLSVKNILDTYSIAKTMLIQTCETNQMLRVECRMTPAVRNNLKTAYKKLIMFGKDMPYVPCYDKFLEELPHEIDVERKSGVKIKMLDPNEYGEYYFELAGVIRNS